MEQEIVIERDSRPDNICQGCGYPKSLCTYHYKPLAQRQAINTRKLKVLFDEHFKQKDIVIPVEGLI